MGLEKAITVDHLNDACVVGLTATLPETEDNNLVKNFFNEFKFHRLLPAGEQVNSVEIPEPKVIGWDGYWSQKTRPNLIVFTREEDYQNVYHEVNKQQCFE